MKRLAAIRTEQLSLDEVITAVSHPGAGAIASFSGVVRNHADGRQVTLLEYEAYVTMAEAEMARILEEIEAEMPEVRVAVTHRIGALQVGELAVVCAASAPHREEGFAACRHCINRIKASVPIWKREHGPEGPYWVGWHDARCADEKLGTSHGCSRHTHHVTNEQHHSKSTKEGSTPLSGLRVSVLTVSDTRVPETDESGRVAREHLERAGGHVAVSEIVRDEPLAIAAWVRGQARSGNVHAIIVTGGTGIAERDRTIEAVEPLLLRTLDGFGEAFRRASFEQIGPHAILSRAKAGIVGSCLVFALPGNPRAVELAVSELIVPTLPHAVDLLVGATTRRDAEGRGES